MVGPILYGLAWAVAAPLLLLWWAVATEPVVNLPALHLPLPGALIGAAGLALMALGMLALKVDGGGLPMNAYPPPRFVAGSVYRYLPHPIYIGFILLAAGVAIATGSASGLWLVTPAAALALTALVLGYEGPDLRRRFGDQVRRAGLALPANADGTATWPERLSLYLYVLLPWLLAYEAVQLLGVPPDGIIAHLPFEHAWPVIEWTEAIYFSAYPLIILTPLLVHDRRALRRFAITGLIATGVVTLIYLTVPLIAPPRPFEPSTWLGHLLMLERATSHTVGAFPAFHVLWPLIAADAWSSRGRRYGAAVYMLAALIAVSTITTGMHALVDILCAAALFPLLRRYDAVWHWLRRSAERIANSWNEWRIGPVRIINHGFYAGAAGALGTYIAGRLAGPGQLSAILVLAVAGLLSAAIWAQVVEGSPRLLRPMGYYGGMIGGLLATGALALLGHPVLPLLGAFAVALPWVQAIGRLRCLVQGCCHGGPAPAGAGICYRHPRSRVTQIAGLDGQPLYPTPLYSILSNIVIGLLLARLWVLGAAPGLVAGLYLILSSVARFVEEAYRAEPQTPVYARLHLYQWLALGGFAAGMVLSTLKAPAPDAAAGGLGLLLGALAIGAAGCFLTGIDFPGSNRPFSRLAPAEALMIDMLPRATGDGWAISTPQEQAMDPSVLAVAYERIAQDPKFKSALGLLVVKGGHLVAEGYMDQRAIDQRGNVKSVTKSVLSLLIGIAIDQGYIKGPHQKLADIYPDLIQRHPDPRAREITIGHLLTMQSGLQWQEHWPWFGIDKDPSALYRASDPVAFMLSKPLAGAPGVHFQYSTGVSQVLAGVIYKATGQTPRDFAAVHLFEPLGIEDVTWTAGKDGISHGGVGLFLSAREMARLGQLVLQQGNWEGRQLISAEWVRTATGGHAIFGYSDGPYGYHWWVRPDGFTAQGARGQYIYVVPEDQLVVVLAAKDWGPRFVDLLDMEDLVNSQIRAAILR